MTSASRRPAANGSMPEASQRTTDTAVTRKRMTSVTPRDADLVARRDLAQEGKMRVAVSGEDRGAGLAGCRRALDMAGPKASA